MFIINVYALLKMFISSNSFDYNLDVKRRFFLTSTISLIIIKHTKLYVMCELLQLTHLKMKFLRSFFSQFLISCFLTQCAQIRRET